VVLHGSELPVVEIGMLLLSRGPYKSVPYLAITFYLAPLLYLLDAGSVAIAQGNLITTKWCASPPLTQHSTVATYSRHDRRTVRYYLWVIFFFLTQN